MRSVMEYRDGPVEPKDYDVPICPVCGEETDTYYKNENSEIVGCDKCITAVDAWEERK